MLRYINGSRDNYISAINYNVYLKNTTILGLSTVNVW